MKIVVVGSGGREHAICDTLVREGHEVIATPGNPGISRVATVTDLHPEALNADLFVVGPEAPLVDGLADRLRAENKITFGPGRDGAQLEGSKEFMKKLAAQAGVPTARFGSFSDSAPALAYLESMTAPYVIKTDGLAAGKGVLVTKDLALAKADVIAKLSGSSFGAAGHRVIIDEAMSGPEVSLLVLVDGKRALALQPATDHKRLYDGDGGPNTGGMGAYSPVGWFVDDQVCLAMDLIVNPVIARMIELGIDYRGILYAGLMVCESGPKLVEFNVRFGDPEAQVVVPALEGSLGELLYGAATGELPQGIARGTQAAAAVVMAAPGYPESQRQAAGSKELMVFLIVATCGYITLAPDGPQLVSYLLGAAGSFR